MLRCRQGDIAIVIHADTQGSRLLGHIVPCVKFVGDYRTGALHDYWEVGDKELLVSDSCLKPIRPQLGNAEDEMLQLVGPPTKQYAFVKRS
jgi:hypothetical protein